MNQPSKTIFKSKTGLASAITAVVGALAFGSASVNDFLSTHASIIVTCLGAAHFALRLVTRGRVHLFAE